MDPIKINMTILAPVEKVWDYFNTPQHIIQWNFAHESWECPHSENDLRIGGKFKNRMEAKDKSFGFDFEGVYDDIIPYEKIKYHLEDGRKVDITFEKVDANTTRITEIFDPEQQNPLDMQRDGWYAILDHFRKYVETH